METAYDLLNIINEIIDYFNESFKLSKFFD